jgi:hypothetical protein
MRQGTREEHRGRVPFSRSNGHITALLEYAAGEAP